MTTALATVAVGFVLGMRHATDPDHVVAVSTIVTRERTVSHAALIGILWGIGHTLMILAVGAAIILFGLAIPARLGLTMEFSVGLMLIALGLLNLTGAIRWLSEKFAPAYLGASGTHAHLHSHGGQQHSHASAHRPESHRRGENVNAPAGLLRSLAVLGPFQILRPLCVGTVHGLAGSAAVALLVLSTIRQPRWAVAYLLVFGVGTIAGMMLITAAMALPFSLVGNQLAWFSRSLATASGLLSLAFGLVVSYHIGFLDGLFSGHPIWTPK